jgi:hypothetical protein
MLGGVILLLEISILFVFDTFSMISLLVFSVKDVEVKVSL